MLAASNVRVFTVAAVDIFWSNKTSVRFFHTTCWDGNLKRPRLLGWKWSESACLTATPRNAAKNKMIMKTGASVYKNISNYQKAPRGMMRWSTIRINRETS